MEHLQRFLKAREIQRIFRGHLGRLAAAREKYRLTILRKKNEASARIQSTWRMKVAREESASELLTGSNVPISGKRAIGCNDMSCTRDTNNS